MMRRAAFAAIALLVVLAVARSAFFTVGEHQYAIVFSFGELRQVIDRPGLFRKWPSPLQRVVYLDKRNRSFDSPAADRFNTAEKKDVRLDAYIKWRIVDPRLYYVSVGGEERRAEERLGMIAKAALNEEVAHRTVPEILAAMGDELGSTVQRRLADESKKIGIGIVDARVKRINYVDDITTAVYERMKADRVRIANDLRSTGAAEAEKIRAEADRQKAVILAQAYKQAETNRGEGDAKAARIYNDAFSQNPEFYRFYRSLEAYRASFKGRQDLIVIDPSSEFFRYFKSPTPAPAPAPSDPRK